MRLIQITIFILLISTFHLKAVTIFSNDINTVDLKGNFNIAYLNNIKKKQIYSYIQNNNYYSNLGILFENKSLDLVTTSIVFDTKINNKYYYSESEKEDSYKALEINNFYVEFKTIDNTNTKIGVFDSLVTAQTVGATSGAIVYLLDAGYSFMNQNSFFGDKAGEDFSTTKIYGIGHNNIISNLSINLEVSSPKNNLTERNQIEENLLSKEYGIGGSISYKGDITGFSIGFQRIKNKFKENNEDVSKSIISSDSLLSSFSLSGNKIYFALSGGYYKNQKLAGINHTGASAYLSYNLTKMIPYIGYQFLYANNIHSSIKNGNDIYKLSDRKNYSFEQSMLVIGLSFEVHNGLLLGIELNNDIRSKSQTNSSLLNSINQDVTSIYIKYSI